MRIAVMGANGTLGRAVVDRAVTRGHDTVAVTRGAPKRAFLRAIHRSADVITGEGVADALAGAEVVVNAVNAQRGAKALFVDGTRRLLEAAEQAGVRHYVAISIVGIDDVPTKYYSVKLEEERLIAETRVGWSLLRATQFHDLVDTMFSQASRFGMLLAPPGAKLQPIEVGEVAAALVEAAEAGPNQRLPDLGGPEIRLVRELAHQWLKATKRTRIIMPAPVVGRLRRRLRDGALCVPDRALGKKTFAEWLAERYGH
jgi:uncharacterized protein YbjT (DUF2867 family)